MICFKKMPDVILTRHSCDEKAYVYDRNLTRSFRRDGKRWAIWRGEYILLRDDGSCVGDTGFHMRWEAI